MKKMTELNESIKPHQLAFRYWRLEPDKRSWETVAAELREEGLLRSTAQPKAVETFLRRLASSCEAKGLVIHQVLSEESGESATLFQRSDLENRLRRRFRLRMAVVVDTSLCLPKPASEKDRERDNRLHEFLGQAAARVLAAQIRREDFVGVGGGRAPYHTVQRVLVREEFKGRVVSLTGQLSAKVPEEVSGPWGPETDADQIAGVLASQLRTNLLDRVNAPLALSSPKKQKVRPKNVDQVTVALIGVGVLRDEPPYPHPLCRYEESEDLFAVKKQLKQVLALTKRVDQALAAAAPARPSVPHHAIGDIGNFLFLAEAAAPHLWKAVPRKDQDQLRQAVNAFNQRTITAELTDYARIARSGAVILVAGGQHKTSVLLHVLKQDPPLITHLVTDDRVATHLVNAEAERDP